MSEKAAIHLEPAGEPKGAALLSYLLEPFSAPATTRPWHPNFWRCRQIAQTFLDMGLAVDVIDWRDERFEPQRDYQFLLDIGCSMSRLAPLVNQDCTKLMFATGKHWLFQNHAELSRLAELKTRRGVALVPRRLAPAGNGLEMCDVCAALGNEGTLETFRYAGKPLFGLPTSSAAEFAWDDAKDSSQARRRFLWLGSSGMVHKGLDLVLEAFAEMPELDLTVCGLMEYEPDFVECYHRELYETPNICTLGFVSVAEPEFATIARETAAIIYPSCSESCAGSVVTSMHAGLIPLVSWECGVEVGNFGEVLAESSVETIKDCVRRLSRQSPEEIRRRSRAAWEFARSTYSREAFAEAFGEVVAGAPHAVGALTVEALV